MPAQVVENHRAIRRSFIRDSPRLQARLLLFVSLIDCGSGTLRRERIAEPHAIAIRQMESQRPSIRSFSQASLPCVGSFSITR